MSSEPTSAFSFGDLLLEVSVKMGTAYYGEDGTEQAQVPIDDHDLDAAKRHVNNAVRMFIHTDAPPTGWRWTRPVYTVALWADIGVLASRTVTGGTYDPINDQTLLTANTAVFYDTMEEKQIVVTGQGTFTIKQYVSATQVYVYGSHLFTAATFSITGDGNYTLPRDFVGTYTGAVTYTAGSDQGTPIEWTSDTFIRQLREDNNIVSGWPSLAAIRTRPAVSGRRRWELMAYPLPQSNVTIEITYDVGFQEMVSQTEPLPTPIAHDETIRAACLSVVEKDVDDAEGPDTQYYRTVCLPASHNLDARSGPRKLGYFGNMRPTITPNNFRDFVRRPNVTYGP